MSSNSNDSIYIVFALLCISACVSVIQGLALISISKTRVRKEVYVQVVNENTRLKERYEREAQFSFEASLPDYMHLGITVDYQDDYDMDDLKMRVVRHAIKEAVADPANWDKIAEIREDARKTLEAIGEIK